MLEAPFLLDSGEILTYSDYVPEGSMAKLHFALPFPRISLKHSPQTASEKISMRTGLQNSNPVVERNTEEKKKSD